MHSFGSDGSARIISGDTPQKETYQEQIKKLYKTIRDVKFVVPDEEEKKKLLDSSMPNRLKRRGRCEDK